MVKEIVSIIGLTLCIQILVHPCTHAWAIHALQKRSLDGQLEIEHNGEAPDIKIEEQGFTRPSQANSFQFLIPFWWHYLRPMLNIFATNTNFRQTLQKEYEYELEHGSEAQETENSPNFEHAEGGEFEFPGHEVELSEREQTHENTFSGDVLNEENGVPDIEHMIESNSFMPFASETESNEQEHTELPELESITENTPLNEDMGNTEEVGNIGDFGIENENREKSEEENRRFFLTGNIVGSFSNSLRNLMPTLREQEMSEHEKESIQFDGFEMNHPSAWEQSADGSLEINGDTPNSESENDGLQTHFNINSLLNNNFGNQIMQGEDIGDRSPRSFGFQNSDAVENELMVIEPHENETQLRESFGLVQAIGNVYPPVDSDNSDFVSDLMPNQLFTTPFSMLSRGLHSQNDQDSGI